MAGSFGIELTLLTTLISLISEPRNKMYSYTWFCGATGSWVSLSSVPKERTIRWKK